MTEKKVMSNKIKVFVILALLLTGFTGVAATSELELLRRKINLAQMESAVNSDLVGKLVETLRPDGTWPGIDYVDVSNTGFQHSIHLNNLVEMSRAYKKKGSKLKGDPKLKKAIYSSLNYWLANDFICENWWWNQIGTPNNLVGLLYIMDTDLTKEQIAKMMPMVGRAHLTASGARPSGDRIKIAGILAKVCLFNRDEAQFNTVIRVIEGEIKFATGRGMQHDFSFHHREDKVNNTLSYGTGYADAFAEWAALVAGTKYQFSTAPLELLTDYYLDGICKQMVYGKYIDTGAKNRDISRADGNHGFGTSTIDNLLHASTYRKNELETIKKCREGEAVNSKTHATFFWLSEYFTLQRPNYFTSVRMYSNRDCNMEMPYNGEGLKNHHRGDGTNYISRTGNEYDDTAPVYDWQKIPGATVVQKPELPSEKEIQKRGITDFVGAATDGTHGVAVMDFRSPHDPLQAKKAWFFFENEYVCLGAGINSDSPYPVATTLNQCLLSADLLVRTDGKTSKPEKGSREIKEVEWIWHDQIAYLFLQPVTLNLSNQTEKGSWYSINHQSDSPRGEVTKEIFKLWFNHGSKPNGATYQYMVVPGIKAEELNNQPERRIQVLSNSTSIQAVRHIALNLSELVFYQSGQVEISKGLTVGMEGPGLVLVQSDGASFKNITVADPSRKLNRMHLTVNARIDKSGANFKTIWNEFKGVTEISIDLPQTVYAGKSVKVEF
jgi:chondroitin AC lyase